MICSKCIDKARRKPCIHCGQLTGNHRKIPICIECHTKIKAKQKIDNTEQVKETARLSSLNWYYNNHDYAIIKAKEWKTNNKERLIEYNKAHVIEKRGYVETRRARLLDQDDGTITGKTWRELISLYDNQCVYCLKKFDSLEQDHVEPLSQGGQHSIYNIVPACRTCNRSKGPNYIEPIHYMWRVLTGISF